MSGNDGKNATGAAWVAGVVGVVLMGFVLYLATTFKIPLGGSLVEMIVGLVCFGLLFYVLARTVFPVFEKLYAERADKIDGGLARAEALREQAEDLKAQYEKGLAEARADAATIRDEARAEGAEVRAELRAAAEADSAQVRAAAAEEIAAQRAAAGRSLRADLGGLSAGMAEKILGAPLSPGAARSVEGFVAELDGSRVN
ncbi:hypothetical protein GCM10009836_70400 [Pseudonocardia ailaonensis]|uniref:ATP synthase subunit b n=1 Tax=Pseudonocardia ailaonensis TaxID=367279 RepID=A0ABN2NP63_9PSEU